MSRTRYIMRLYFSDTAKKYRYFLIFFKKVLDKTHFLWYNSKAQYGRLAQLGEHLPYKQRVTGSSPVLSTKKENAASSTTSTERGSNPANARSVFGELARLRDNSEPMYFPPES